MKTKAQKQEQLEKGRKLLQESKTLIFADFGALSAEEMRRLRRDVKSAGAQMVVIKKRLMNLIFQEKKSEVDLTIHKVGVGTIFSKGAIEEVSGPVYRFFKELKIEKDKILGGYDVATNSFITPDQVRFVGQLPSRQVLLGQLVGLLASPIKSFLFVLNERVKIVDGAEQKSTATN